MMRGFQIHGTVRDKLLALCKYCQEETVQRSILFVATAAMLHTVYVTPARAQVFAGAQRAQVHYSTAKIR
jgi:hypothetical protein